MRAGTVMRKKIAMPAKTTSLTPLSTYCSQSMTRVGADLGRSGPDRRHDGDDDERDEQDDGHP